MFLAKPLWEIKPKIHGDKKLWFHYWSGLVADEETLVQYYSPDEYIDALVRQSGSGNTFSSDPPSLLFRGQRQLTTQILSPMARAFLSSHTNGYRIHVLGWDPDLTKIYSETHALSGHPPYWEEVRGLQVPMDMGQILARFTLHVSMNLRVGVQSNWYEESRELPGRPILMTPFHLALFLGPQSVDAAGEGACAAGMQVLTETLQNIPDGFVKAYVAHLTDYELPVPLVGRGGITRDFVPNPFVSTTTNLRIALLYGSGYFNTFSDKFNVDWREVYARCMAPGNDGVIYILRIARPVLPITKVAGSETIGAEEAEYAIPGEVNREEVVEVIRVRDLVRNTNLTALDAYLSCQRSTGPDPEEQYRIIEGG